LIKIMHKNNRYLLLTTFMKLKTKSKPFDGIKGKRPVQGRPIGTHSLDPVYRTYDLNNNKRIIKALGPGKIY